jgi:hypothetical protein
MARVAPDGEPLELFRHAAPELEDTLDAQCVLRIPLGVEQQRCLYVSWHGDEFTD